jgi:hypothetical protein
MNIFVPIMKKAKVFQMTSLIEQFFNFIRTLISASKIKNKITQKSCVLTLVHRESNKGNNTPTFFYKFVFFCLTRLRIFGEDHSLNLNITVLRQCLLTLRSNLSAPARCANFKSEQRTNFMKFIMHKFCHLSENRAV